MNKHSLVFKISSLLCLIVDIAFAVFCTVSLVSVMTKYTLLTRLHFVIFYITLAINGLYFLYILTTLIYNKIRG